MRKENSAPSPRIAVLLLAHGSPDRLEQMEEFLRRVRRGKPLRPEVLQEVTERYRRIGGRSPLLDITRDQAVGLQKALGDEYRTFVGMKYWHPLIPDTAREIHAEGLRTWISVVMAPQYSRMSTGVYHEMLEEAAATLDPPPRVCAVPDWHRLKGFLGPVAARVQEAIDRFPEEERERVAVILTAHSLPEKVREWNDPYPGQFQETAEGVMALVGERPWRMAYQSQGMTHDPWLGPGVNEVLEEMDADGVRGVVVSPIGFVADHVEVLYDIDVEHKEFAEEKGMRLERSDSLNADPAFLQALADVVKETVAKLDPEDSR
ncbi:MAG: ferrochelatase [Planctomycetota bacterium]|nr:ferrochelatase [Planctomycetota bacterium]